MTRPRVTCIMPTRDRPGLAAQACRYFLRQTWGDAELVVVADGAPLPAWLRGEGRIRVVEIPDRRTVGEKRNVACAFALGDVVVHWDDDDWYGPERLALQVEPILSGRADVTALRCDATFDLRSGTCWSCSPREHARLFHADVHGGTLAFARRVWSELARFPSQSLAEDAAFLAEATRRGARLEAGSGEEQFVYLRHGGNAWAGFPRDLASNPEWSLRPVPAAMREDLPFYRALRDAASPGRSPRTAAAGADPLVSCIMPTADRPRHVARAVEYFGRQDHPRRELVVVDDGDVSVERLVAGVPGGRYLRVAPGLSLGAKRNLACERARGEIIAHWDDDDWYAADRLSVQVGDLRSSGAEVTGLADLLFWDVRSQRAWRYRYDDGRSPWLHGATLCYTADAWARRRFADLSTGEDNDFLSRFVEAETSAGARRDVFVGIIHESNSSPKHLWATSWSEVDASLVESAMPDDFPRYVRRVHDPV